MSNYRERQAMGAEGQAGVSTVVFAIALLMITAFAALAVDGSNLFVARNELQNAADAGALAGARVLYTDDGSSVNAGANQVAQSTAASNNSQGNAVEVVSVRRGHWSFTNGAFTHNPSLEPVDLFSATTAELDLDPNFINAVEVITERRSTPVQSFFGRILGLDSYHVRSRAVAYLGFASSLRPEDADQPIGICKQVLTSSTGSYNCSVGTMIPATSDTAGWTNFQQNEDGGANAGEIKEHVCADGNPEELHYGEPMQTTNGQVHSAFKEFHSCWKDHSQQGTKPWNLTLPVLDCPAGQVGPNNNLIGAVNINVIWVVDKTPEVYDQAPWQMEMPPDDSEGVSPGTWTSNADGETRWNDFTDHFNLQNSDGSRADMNQKTIYFLPDCSYHEPKGTTGGENFGVLARIPVLVD